MYLLLGAAWLAAAWLASVLTGRGISLADQRARAIDALCPCDGHQ